MTVQFPGSPQAPSHQPGRDGGSVVGKTAQPTVTSPTSVPVPDVPPDGTGSAGRAPLPVPPRVAGARGQHFGLTVEQQLIAEAFEDCYELFPYADRMNARPEGHVYLRLLEETAHDALAWAHAHLDH